MEILQIDKSKFMAQNLWLRRHSSESEDSAGLINFTISCANLYLESIQRYPDESEKQRLKRIVRHAIIASHIEPVNLAKIWSIIDTSGNLQKHIPMLCAKLVDTQRVRSKLPS